MSSQMSRWGEARAAVVNQIEKRFDPLFHNTRASDQDKGSHSFDFQGSVGIPYNRYNLYNRYCL
jgi:hypothetical protein